MCIGRYAAHIVMFHVIGGFLCLILVVVVAVKDTIVMIAAVLVLLLCRRRDRCGGRLRDKVVLCHRLIVLLLLSPLPRIITIWIQQ